MNANFLLVVQTNSKQAKLLGTVRSIRTTHCTSPAHWLVLCTDADVRGQLNSDIIASCVRTLISFLAGRLEDTLMVDLSRVMVG
ncbi:hypothetical protein P692DRAFT_20651052, partial [Suillus brevipes Sb2]